MTGMEPKGICPVVPMPEALEEVLIGGLGRLLTASATVSGKANGDSTRVRLTLSEDNDCDSDELPRACEHEEDEAVTFRYPGLCLQHEHHTLGEDHSSSRKLVQNHVAFLLARELSVDLPRAGNPQDSLFEVPRTLLQNVYESFAVLVDSRLRAYAVHLASEALARGEDEQSLKKAEEKIDALLEKGRSISVSWLKSRCEIEDPQNAEEDSESEAVTLPLRLGFSLGLSLASSSSNKQTETMDVSFAATGRISGEFRSSGTRSTSQLKTICLELDTNEFLPNMMAQAAQVVSTVSGLFSADASKNLLRSESYLAMPPPCPKKPLAVRPVARAGGQPSVEQAPRCKPFQHRFQGEEGRPLRGLDLLSMMAAELPIVSPDISSRSSPMNRIVPCMNLDDAQEASSNNEEDEDVTDLSVEQCAEVVDCIFAGVSIDDAALMGPPVKKPKLDS